MHMIYRHTRSVFIAFLMATALAVALPISSFAQTFRGGINGTVTDESGAVVPGAAVEATDSATGVSHKTITLERGRVQLSGHAARCVYRSSDWLRLQEVELSRMCR